MEMTQHRGGGGIAIAGAGGLYSAGASVDVNKSGKEEIQVGRQRGS